MFITFGGHHLVCNLMVIYHWDEAPLCVVAALPLISNISSGIVLRILAMRAVRSNLPRLIRDVIFTDGLEREITGNI